MNNITKFFQNPVSLNDRPDEPGLHGNVYGGMELRLDPSHDQRDQRVCCPVCGDAYGMHSRVVEVSARREEGGDPLFVRVFQPDDFSGEGPNASYEVNEDVKRVGHRQHVAIQFFCECCGPIDRVLRITQHKGMTYIGWHLPRSQDEKITSETKRTLSAWILESYEGFKMSSSLVQYESYRKWCERSGKPACYHAAFKTWLPILVDLFDDIFSDTQKDARTYDEMIRDHYGDDLLD